MPICHKCHGTGQEEIEFEVTRTCPTCMGGGTLPDSSECDRCEGSGQVGTDNYTIFKQLCHTCWGSGRVSQLAMWGWFSVRAVPASLLILGSGAGLLWLAWLLLTTENILLFSSSVILTLTLGLWYSLFLYFAHQLTDFGEMAATPWFLLRAVPTTMLCWGAGSAWVWTLWILSQNPQATGVLALGAFITWSISMFYFISELPN